MVTPALPPDCSRPGGPWSTDGCGRRATHLQFSSSLRNPDRRAEENMKVSSRSSGVRLASAALMLGVAFGSLAWLGAAGTQGLPRERLLLSAGWRFQKGDPAGVDSRDLLYD